MGFVADAFDSVTGFIGDTLFGSDGSPSQVIDTTDPAFKELRPEVSNQFADLLRSFGAGNTSAPFLQSPEFQAGGQLVAPQTQAEKDFLARLNSLAGGSTPLQGQARDVLSKTLSGDFLSPDSNPFLQDAIQAATRPVVERFNEVTLPGVISQFKRAGQTLRSNPDNFDRPGSSAFLNQVRLADKDIASQIGDIATNISFQNFNNERARQLQATESAERITTQDIDNTIKTLQANELPRLIDQLGIDKGLAEFNRRAQLLLQILNQGIGASQGQITQLPGTPATEGIFGDLAKIGTAVALK